MLSQDVLERAYPLVEQLDARRVYLAPVPGTPLASLVEATRMAGVNHYSLPNQTGAVADPQVQLGDIAFMANCINPATNESDHDVAMNRVVENGIAGLTNQVRAIRTVVKPAVVEMAEKTMLALQGLPGSEILGLEVRTYTPPEAFSNKNLLKEVLLTQAMPFDNPTLGLKLPVMAVSDIIKLAETGVTTIDGDVQDWLARKGNDFVAKVWETLFTENELGLTTNRVLMLRDYIDDPYEGAEWSLLTFLLARKLWDNPPEGTAMELRAYNEKVQAFRDQSASNVARAMDQLAQHADSGRMVLELQRKWVVVLEPVYKKWLEENNGTNEVLLGMIVLQKPLFTVEDIVAASAELQDTWTRQESLARTEEAARRKANCKGIMRSIFVDQLYSSTEENETSEEIRQRIVALFDNELSLVNEEDCEVDRLFLTSTRLLCRSRFVRSDAENFLNWFNKIMKDNPGTSEMEAATQCAIKYVARWMAEQVEVKVLPPL